MNYTASDGRGGTDPATLSITIYGQNESGPLLPPRIDDQLLTLSEGQPGPLQPLASEPDGSLGALRWRLIGGADAAFFTLDPLTGASLFKTAPDYEAPTDFGTNNIYQLIVQVTDRLGTGQSDSGIVNVQVLDVNEAPALADRTVSLYEQSGTAVTTLAGTEPDSTAPNRTLSYSIVAGQGDGALFAIDPVSGALTFITAPDYETPLDTAFGGDAAGNNIYHVVVRATDGGSPTLHDDAVVTVNVLDVNDLLPLAVTLQAQPGNLQVGARLNFLDTTPVLEITSTAGASIEVDWNDGQWMTSLVSGQSRFDLSALTPDDGYVIRGLKYQFAQQQSIASGGVDINGDGRADFSIGALPSNSSDAGVSNRWLPGVVRGPNTSGNDAPVLPAQHFQLPEQNAGAFTVLAGDADDEKTLDGQFIYGIFGGADAQWFVIDPATGVLRFTQFMNFDAPLDADGDNVYQVQVGVTDRLGDPSGLTGTALVPGAGDRKRLREALVGQPRTGDLGPAVPDDREFQRRQLDRASAVESQRKRRLPAVLRSGLGAADLFVVAVHRRRAGCLQVHDSGRPRLSRQLSDPVRHAAEFREPDRCR